MYDLLVQKRFLGVLGGQDVNPSMFKFWGQKIDVLIAADSGADVCIKHDLMPDVIIGDFDSIQTPLDKVTSKLIKIEDQNLSDCDKLLNYVSESGSSEVVLLGIEGDRLDHQLASLSSIINSSLRVRLGLRDGIADILRPGKHRVTVGKGNRVSIMPLVSAKQVSIRKVAWELQEVVLELGQRHSLSNIAVENEIEIEFMTGVLFVSRPLNQNEIPLWPGEDTV